MIFKNLYFYKFKNNRQRINYKKLIRTKPRVSIEHISVKASCTDSGRTVSPRKGLGRAQRSIKIMFTVGRNLMALICISWP